MKNDERQKTAYFEAGIWLNSETGAIHLTGKGIDGAEFITTVNCNSGSMREHQHLYRKLAKSLKLAGMPNPKS